MFICLSSVLLLPSLTCISLLLASLPAYFNYPLGFVQCLPLLAKGTPVTSSPESVASTTGSFPVDEICLFHFFKLPVPHFKTHFSTDIKTPSLSCGFFIIHPSIHVIMPQAGYAFESCAWQSSHLTTGSSSETFNPSCCKLADSALQR